MKIALAKKTSKLQNLKKRDVMSAKPSYYIHLDWFKKWLLAKDNTIRTHYKQAVW